MYGIEILFQVRQLLLCGPVPRASVDVMSGTLKVDQVTAWYDENVPSSEGVRPRGDDDVVEGHIAVEVASHLTH